jgi:hypothetical protein
MNKVDLLTTSKYEQQGRFDLLETAQGVVLNY